MTLSGRPTCCSPACRYRWTVVPVAAGVFAAPTRWPAASDFGPIAGLLVPLELAADTFTGRWSRRRGRGAGRAGRRQVDELPEFA
ncbi:hypothetical protein [Streptomyces narbonensis]